MAVWVSCLQLSTLPFTCVFTFAFLLHSSQLLPIVYLTLAFTFPILLHSSKLHPIVQFTFASTFTILLQFLAANCPLYGRNYRCWLSGQRWPGLVAKLNMKKIFLQNEINTAFWFASTTTGHHVSDELDLASL